MLTLYKQLSSGEALIFFGDSLTSQGLVCGSSEKEVQINFILSALKKYSQITLTNRESPSETIEKIKKHYQKSPNQIIVQKSYYKFLKEKLVNLENEQISFESIFDNLD